MTIQATIKNVEPIYSEAREIIRAIIELEEDSDLLVVIGAGARDISEYVAGTHVEVDVSMNVTLTDNRPASLVDHIHAI